MALNSETVYAALWSRVSAIGGIMTLSRRLQHVNDVKPDLQPALFQAQTYQRHHYETGRVTFVEMGAVLYLYVRNPKTAIPGQLFNTILDNIRAALAPDNANANACTLGGLVHWTRIGNIDTDEGTLGEQCIARVEIEMKAPA